MIIMYVPLNGCKCMDTFSIYHRNGIILELFFKALKKKKSPKRLLNFLELKNELILSLYNKIQSPHVLNKASYFGNNLKEPDNQIVQRKEKCFFQ